MLPLTASGCFVPPAGPFESKENKLPKLVVIRPPLGLAPISITDTFQDFEIEVVDPDPGLISLRFFVNTDYSVSLPLTEPTVQPNRQVLRSLQNICPEKNDTPQLLELYVSDSGFASGRTVNPGGARDHVSWRFTCDELPGGG